MAAHRRYKKVKGTLTMAKPSRSSRLRIVPAMGAFVVVLSSLIVTAQQPGTAWRDGKFQVDAQGVVGRSDVILNRANLSDFDAMPLGNGRLGVAVWAQDCYTAQLNREDTWPKRLSPGQVVIPGLCKLARAGDYKGRLDLYNGEFVERGAGMMATTYVDSDLDVMVVDVRGADPGTAQTAELKLWPGRKPAALAGGAVGSLAETWRDTNELGASGLTFGSLSAITADGENVQARVVDPLTIEVTFKPHADGSYRILVASPYWQGGDAQQTGADLLDQAKKTNADTHRNWWHAQWARTDLMRMTSADGTAEYFENLRMIDLFTTVAESRDRFPGSQAGIGDLFSSFKDFHYWGPSSYWHWNLRMQVSANLGAGLAEYNEPYFNLYNDNLDNIAKWTRDHMGGRPGICIPETMRFNGPGYENEFWLKSQGISCSQDSRPYYNARTISTGAEVALWVWQQYQTTDDRQFLETHYKLMHDAAVFLLSYASKDPDGKLYTYPSNAHESNWDVRNPTTDVAAMHALFPAIIQAAKILNIDQDFAKKLEDLLPSLPALPLVNSDAGPLLHEGDSLANAYIANSYTLDATKHNEENIGLEPVWPYSIIGDDGPLHDVAVRTYARRPNKHSADWSADPEQAARLGLAPELKAALVALTERYQAAPSGLATFTVHSEFYVEQVGVVADALQNALVQDYDGLLRIAPAWPKDWSVDGSVSIQHKGRVYVQLHQGRLVTVGIQTGDAQTIRIRNPWPDEGMKVQNAATGADLARCAQKVCSFDLRADTAYLVAPATSVKLLPFEQVSGVPASAPKKLGSRTIGLPAAR